MEQRFDDVVVADFVELLAAIDAVGDQHDYPAAAARTIVQELGGGKDGVVERFGRLALDGAGAFVDRGVVDRGMIVDGGAAEGSRLEERRRPRYRDWCA